MGESLAGTLPSVIILGSFVLAALITARRRPIDAASPGQKQDAARALLVATILQTTHFVEETATGFQRSLPAVFDLPAIPLPLFALFNLFCIAAWFASVPALRTSRKPALAAAWFLAIAGTANGIAHPLLAIAAEGYFPGLVTAPLVGLAAIVLGIRLSKAAG
jgi:hypothetical protein